MPRPSGISHEFVDQSPLQGVTVPRMHFSRVYCKRACLHTGHQRTELLRLRSGKVTMVIDHEVYCKLKQYGILRALVVVEPLVLASSVVRLLWSALIHTVIRSFIAPRFINSHMDYVILVRVTLAGCHLRYYVKSSGYHSTYSLFGSCLIQWDDDGRQKPIAFASVKQSGAQLAGAAIEKEAYAIVWSLNKFRTWIFGSPIAVFADSNLLTYSIASAPKSAKLTRWILALQEFNIVFKYTKGRDHVLPGYLSRPN
jgi:RNase H-like domain found in reverse transcriptase